MESRLKLAIAAFVLALTVGAGLNTSGLVNVQMASLLFGVAGCSFVYIVWEFIRNVKLGAIGGETLISRVLVWPGVRLCGYRLAIEHISVILAAALSTGLIVLFIATSQPEPWRGWLQPANEPTPANACDIRPVEKDAVKVLLGDNTFFVTQKYLASRQNKFVPLSICGTPALSVESGPNGLRINNTVYDYYGRRIGKIVDNGYEIIKNDAKAIVEHSGDLSSLVVHDSAGHELLYVQYVHYINRNTLRVRGAFICHPGQPSFIVNDETISPAPGSPMVVPKFSFREGCFGNADTGLSVGK